MPCMGPNFNQTRHEVQLFTDDLYPRLKKRVEDNCGNFSTLYDIGQSITNVLKIKETYEVGNGLQRMHYDFSRYKYLVFGIILAVLPNEDYHYRGNPELEATRMNKEAFATLTKEKLAELITEGFYSIACEDF